MPTITFCPTHKRPSLLVEGYLQKALADTAAAVRPVLLSAAIHLTRNQDAAEDLVQEAYLRMVERPPRSRSKRKVQAWLMLVMRHVWADRFPRPTAGKRRTAPRPAGERGEMLMRAALRGGAGPRELIFAAGADSFDG